MASLTASKRGSEIRIGGEQRKGLRAVKKVRTVEVSIPGLGRLLNPQYEKLPKIIWVSVMLICLSICIYLTVNRLDSYFNYPTKVQSLVSKKKNVTFPSFSICSSKTFGRDLAVLMEREIKKNCRLQNLTCISLSTLSFKELNLNWTNILKNYTSSKPMQVSAKLPPMKNSTADETEESDEESIKIDAVNKGLGTCRVVTHTQEIVYFSAGTYLKIKIIEDVIGEKFYYTFIPHGRNASEVLMTDILTHEYNYIEYAAETNIRILHQKFKMLNGKDEAACYNVDEERKRVNKCAMRLLKKEKDLCRLPFLPDYFRECKNVLDVLKSIDKLYNVMNTNLRPICSMRRICKENVYSVTIDSVKPNLSFTLNENSVETSFTIRFADDLIHLNEEYYTYELPTLVSDLAAYWGFFLCISALVFVEILEYLLSSIYYCLFP